MKTLKDMNKYLPEDPYCGMVTFHKSSDKRTSNSKYYNAKKTLFEKNGLLQQSELRQEAIRHLLFQRIQKYSHDIMERERSTAICYWIKHFFNITDEELSQKTEEPAE